MTPEEFQTLTVSLERLQRKQLQAEGGLNEMKQRLQRDFGAETFRAGRELLLKIGLEIEEDEIKFAAALKEFEKQHAAIIN